MSKLLLIDGHSILNRAFYGVPDLTNSEGIHTNAMYGFLNIMFKFIDEEQPDYITVAFDLSAPTFRHLKYSGYKQTRKPMVAELKQQVPLIKDVLRSMKITIVEKEGFEADDILGTLANKSAANGIDVSIISGDRDLLQLAQEHIKIRIPKTKKGVTEVEDYLPDDVKELYHVSPLEFIDVKALMGDTSDNIPGAPGIGPKTASALIEKYHDIDNVFAHIDELKPPKAKKSVSENIEQIKLSKYLATIDINVPLEYEINDCKTGGYFNADSYELFKKYNFKSFFKRFNEDSVKNEFEAMEHFKTVYDFNEVDEIFNEAASILKAGGEVGISILNESEKLIGISAAFDDTKIFYIPVQGFATAEYLTDKLAELAKNTDKRQIIISNIKAALSIFGNDYPIDNTAFADVSIAAYLINPNNENYEYDSLASSFLGIVVPSGTEITGKCSYSEAARNNEENVARLACLKSIISLKAWKKIKGMLIEEEMSDLFNNIEMPLTFVLYSMQKAGIRVNKDGLVEYSSFLGDNIESLQKEIYSEAGETFNINSPKQLGEILFEKLKMPNGKKTKSGYSTAANVLEKLAPDYPVVNKILKYRQLSKLKSTYADGLVNYISDDGRIHGTFNQTITATGRISSTEPNLQNIPIRMELGREIRKVFVPQDGYVFIDADYSQIELRILAHMSGDNKLIDAYNKEQDIHRITASQVFNIPYEEVTDELRRNAKAVNFGIIYGISSFGLSEDLSISKKDAKEYIEKYFKTYPDIKGYIDGLVEFAKKTGYSLTMFKRRRQIPELKSSNFMQRAFGERVAMNAPIQGTAADIIKLAMIAVDNRLKSNNMKSRLILQVHDELLVETHKDEINEVEKIVRDSMINAAHLKVKLEVDLKTGNNWLEAH